MTIRIGSNIASLNAQRRLGEAGDALSKTFERLSSGQRINRASDDAAGLAIADDLKAKGRVYTQAIRNGNDGISLLNIADSAIDALTSVVVRIRELSEQAANGTYSQTQREALDNEAQQLSKEFSRITQTTSFNGLKIFDGSLSQGVRLQLGIGTAESINASIGGAIGTGQFHTQSAAFTTEGLYSTSIELKDINNDGNLDIITAGVNDNSRGYVSVRLGLNDGGFSALTQYSSESTESDDLKVVDLNGDGFLDLITSGYDSANGLVTIRSGDGKGNFGTLTQVTMNSSYAFRLEIADLNNDNILDLITAGGNDLSQASVAVRLGTGNNNFGSLAVYSESSGSAFRGLSVADLNNDGILDLVASGSGENSVVKLGNGNGTFGNSITLSTDNMFATFDLTTGDINGDGIQDLITAGFDYYDSVGVARVRLGNGDGTFGNFSVYSTEESFSFSSALADLNSDGFLDLITTGRDNSVKGSLSIRTGRGDGTFNSVTNYKDLGPILKDVALGDLNGDGVTDIVAAGQTYPGDGYGKIFLAQTKEGLGALLDFSLDSKSEALQAMSILDKTLQNLAKQRGTIGASQSRINIALNNLQSARENFNAAESRIRDADIAQESSALIRTQILQQAATSVLSQANQAPQLALKLLN